MEDRYSIKNLTKDILILLAAGAIILPVAAVAPGLTLALKPFLKRKNYQPARIKTTLSRLAEQKVISIKKEDGVIKLQLLDKGHKKVLYYRIEDLKFKQDKWDGLWRLVIFDIPEKQKDARNFLRFKLKELGMYKLQKSVLVTPWECKEIVDFVKHYYEVGDCVILVLAKSFDGEESLRKHFNLN